MHWQWGWNAASCCNSPEFTLHAVSDGIASVSKQLGVANKWSKLVNACLQQLTAPRVQGLLIRIAEESYWSFSNSALASFRTEISASASFQSFRKS
jgi:hypothetical protein